MSAVIGQPGVADHGEAHDHPHGWRRWLFATNHKDIGTLYLWFSFTMFIVGGVNALLLRSELFQPGLQLFQPEFFNQLTTMHGLIMVFGAIMPAFVGFANWHDPAADRRERHGVRADEQLQLLAAASRRRCMLVARSSCRAAPPARLDAVRAAVVQMGRRMDLGDLRGHILGASSIMGSINIIVTI
jgi:cytochrome c oxidase subunit 1